MPFALSSPGETQEKTSASVRPAQRPTIARESFPFATPPPPSQRNKKQPLAGQPGGLGRLGPPSVLGPRLEWQPLFFPLHPSFFSSKIASESRMCWERRPGTPHSPGSGGGAHDAVCCDCYDDVGVHRLLPNGPRPMSGRGNDAFDAGAGSPPMTTTRDSRPDDLPHRHAARYGTSPPQENTTNQKNHLPQRGHRIARMQNNTVSVLLLDKDPERHFRQSARGTDSYAKKKLLSCLQRTQTRERYTRRQHCERTLRSSRARDPSP